MPDPNQKNERRFFLCTGQVVHLSDVVVDRGKYADSHILGELVYITDEGRRVTALAIFENSICADEVPPANPEIVNYAIGDSRKIWCRHGIRTPHRCVRKQRWEIGKAAMDALMEKMGLQAKALEFEKTEKGAEAL